MKTMTPIRPVHWIRAWTSIDADEAPICGAPIDECFMYRTTIGTTHNSEDQPMPICEACIRALACMQPLP